MGSYFGHAHEAIFFLVLGSWWMYNAFPAYIKALWHGDDYKTRLSYSLSGSRQVPIEAICKVIFTIAGFLVELFANGGPKFLDENNDFINMNRIQHMSIFGFFVLHSIIDLLMRLGAPLPRGFDRITFALAFTWYGICFSFHAHMEGKAGMEIMLHMLPTYIMYLIGTALVLETIRPSWFLPHLVRIYGMLMLGSWTLFTAYVLYKPRPFPGGLPNPNWNSSDARNKHFIVAAFGYNLSFILAGVTIIYLITLCVLKARGHHQPQYNQMAPLFQRKEGKSCLRSL